MTSGLWRQLIRAGALVAGLVAGFAGGAPGQEVTCSLGSVPGPYGYQRRGDRCEGLYERQVGGTPLSIVSLTGTFEDFDATSGDPLRVSWSGPDSGDVWIRAEGIRRKFYYRMETQRPANGGAYQWPPDVLAALKVTRSHIGMLGWTRRRVGTVERDVRIPLDIVQHNAAASCRTYLLVLFPGVKLSEVYVSLASLGPDGKPVAWLRRDAPLLYGYYPAETPIRVPLAELAAPGLYELTVGARLASGGSTAVTQFVYQPDHSPSCEG